MRLKPLLKTPFKERLQHHSLLNASQLSQKFSYKFFFIFALDISEGTLPNSFYKVNISLIPKSVKDTTKKRYKPIFHKYISNIKDTITSIDLKGIQQSSTYLQDKSSRNFRNILNTPQKNKAIHNKPIANIILRVVQLRAFPLKPRTR